MPGSRGRKPRLPGRFVFWGEDPSDAAESRFRFAIAGGSKERAAPNRSTNAQALRTLSKFMQNFLRPLTNHWLAKLLSLLLAVTLWAVIRSNVKGTNSLSRIQLDNTRPSADGKFDISTSIHGDRKK